VGFGDTRLSSCWKFRLTSWLVSPKYGTSELHIQGGLETDGDSLEDAWRVHTAAGNCLNTLGLKQWNGHS
jgi:hypothetical protein